MRDVAHVEVVIFVVAQRQRVRRAKFHRSEIALDYVPVVPRIGKGGGVCDVGAIHGPDRRQATVVLPENIGLAVAAEIGRRNIDTAVRQVRTVMAEAMDALQNYGSARRRT